MKKLCEECERKGLEEEGWEVVRKARDEMEGDGDDEAEEAAVGTEEGGLRE